MKYSNPYWHPLFILLWYGTFFWGQIQCGKCISSNQPCTCVGYFFPPALVLCFASTSWYQLSVTVVSWAAPQLLYRVRLKVRRSSEKKQKKNLIPRCCSKHKSRGDLSLFSRFWSQPEVCIRGDIIEKCMEENEMPAFVPDIVLQMFIK